MKRMYTGKATYEIRARTASDRCINECFTGFDQNKIDNPMFANNNITRINS
jgi:hypothetical protein